MKKENYGAPIERGKIETIEENGYRVSSITRDGITSKPMQPIGTDTLSVGDMVYYFMFPDGTGMIICKI